MISLRLLLKLFLSVLLVSLPLQKDEAQALAKLRSTTGSCGSSNTFTANGQQYYIQHSIGQSSAIGLVNKKNYQLSQGFIQPLKVSIGNYSMLQLLPAEIFPNPFSDHLVVSFSGETSDILYVTLYDLNGKIVFLKKFEASRELNLDMGFLAPAVYFIRVNTATKCFYSKVIKL